VTIVDDPAEETETRLDRNRDTKGWVLTPVLTLLLGPAVAASLSLLVAEDSTSYPGLCDGVAAANGCQEAVTGMFAVHIWIFLAGWLLLWAVPWWRGLRAYRIGFAVLIGLVLLAAPLRLLGSTSVPGFFSLSPIDQMVDDHTRDPGDMAHTGVALTVAGAVLIGFPLALFVLFAVTGRQFARKFCVGLMIVALLPAALLLQQGVRQSDRADQWWVVHAPDKYNWCANPSNVNGCPPQSEH
jgi:hypothetical protein